MKINTVTMSNETDRVYQQKRGWEIFRGQYKSYIDAELKKRLDVEAYIKYKKYISPKRNPLRRIAKIQSVTYYLPPRRICNSGAEAILRDKTADLNKTLQYVEELVNAVGDVFVMPYYSELDQKIHLEIIPPHLVDVSVSRSEATAFSVAIRDDITRIFRPDGTYRDVDKNGNTLQKYSSPYRHFPLVWFRSAPILSEDFWGIWDSLDVVNATIDVGVLETFHNRVSYLRSFKQPTVSAAEVEEATGSTKISAQVGPDRILPFQMSTIDLADTEDKFLESIRKIEADIAGSRGISTVTYFSDFEKGEKSLTTVSNELRQRWRWQTQIMSTAEKQLLSFITEVYSVNNGSDRVVTAPNDWTIDYIEPIPELDNPLTSLKVLEQSIALGVDNVQQWLLRNNADLKDETQAMEIIQKNIDVRAIMVEKMRALNMPKDPTQIGADAEENGAGGQPVVTKPLRADPV